MYFKITDNCNTLCPVCGRLCVTQTPDFESIQKFEKELYFNFYGIKFDYGSETSKFWSKLIEVLVSTSEQYLEWMSVHSKQKFSELRLAPFSNRRGLVDCELCLDDWCEPINPGVAKSFTLLPGNDMFYPKTEIVVSASKAVRDKNSENQKKCLCKSNLPHPSLVFDVVVKTEMAKIESDPGFSSLYRIDMKFKKQDSAGLATPMYLSAFNTAWLIQIQF